MTTPPFWRRTMTAKLSTAAGIALALLAGCAEHQTTGTPVLVDPTSTQRESGGTDDVLEVSQKMVGSMRRDPKIVARPVPRLILLDEDGITVDPKLHDYNARILYHQLTANLNRAAGNEFRFIDRKAVSRERERQLRGEVKTGGIDPVTAGADMTLKIELSALQRAKTSSVQDTFALTGL